MSEHEVARAQAVFKHAGLAAPPVPGPLAADLEERAGVNVRQESIPCPSWQTAM